MAVAWWWYLAVNATVAAVAVLSSRERPQQGITRRASSAVLQRLRSLSIFSFPPSDCLHDTTGIPQPLDAVVDAHEPEEEPAAVTSPVTSSTLELVPDAHDTEEEPAAETSPVTSSTLELVPAPTAPVPETEEDSDPNAMSLDEAYALVVAARQRPESEREKEARISEVDAKAEEFIRRFKESLREQRLNSTFSS